MDVNFLGHIEGVRYTDTSVIVTASERRSGYKKADGTIVPDELLTFKFIYKPYFKKYISEHFSTGMLVKIKGNMLPYAKDRQGNIIEGYSIIGETINRATYQTNSLRAEKRLVKESLDSTNDTPDLAAFNEPDF